MHALFFHMHVDIKDLFLTGMMVIAQLSFLFLSVCFDRQRVYTMSPQNNWIHSIIVWSTKSQKSLKCFFPFLCMYFFFTLSSRNFFLPIAVCFTIISKNLPFPSLLNKNVYSEFLDLIWKTVFHAMLCSQKFRNLCKWSTLV